MNAFRGLRSLTTLDLYNNKLSLIRNDTFKDMPLLEELKLYENRIECVETNAFRGLVNLKILRLNANRLRTLDAGVFNDLSLLEELYIQKNSLISFQDNLFDGLVNLIQLECNSNLISFIRVDTLKQVSKLQTLRLFENNLRFIESNAFERARDLLKVELQQNKIEVIGTRLFRDLVDLETIDLSQNRIDKIERHAFANLPSLTQLDLSHNYLSELEDVFVSVTALAWIDLSFNYIRILANENTALFSVEQIILTSNGIKRLNAENFAFNSVDRLDSLYLEFNELTFLDRNFLSHLKRITSLSLANNLIKCLEYTALDELNQLEDIDLSNNFIESIGSESFARNAQLKSINLNNNSIRFIHANAFGHLKYLTSFKIGQNNLSLFDMSLLLGNNLAKLIDLDVSFNRIAVPTNLTLDSIVDLHMARVSFEENSNRFLSQFLGTSVKKLDMSNNNFASTSFHIFDCLVKIKELRLSNVGIQSMQQIDFSKFELLSHLDLSFNNLTRLDFAYFPGLQALKHLDLSNNQIGHVDERIFGSKLNGFLLKTFDFLNLENNHIISLSSDNVLYSYMRLGTFRIANNNLSTFPQIVADIFGTVSVTEFFLNENAITSIQPLNFAIHTLLILNLDSNRIATLEADAFANLESLTNLSISQNRLTSIFTNDFASQKRLVFLCLSYNQIEFVEENSFQSLESLLVLDLSLNRLKSISQNFFGGLTKLDELHLLNSEKIQLENGSFRHFSSINTIFLNESTILAHKCLFMHSMPRISTRNVNKKSFYKSINLISTPQFKFDFCSVTFQFLQFRVHFNLKTEYQNEQFYEKCQANIIHSRENQFMFSKSKCFPGFEFGDEIKTTVNLENISRFMSTISNPLYLLIMIFVFILLGPGLVLMGNTALNDLANHVVFFSKRKHTINQIQEEDSPTNSHSEIEKV